MTWPATAQFKGGMAVYTRYGSRLILRNRRSQPRRARFRERKESARARTAAEVNPTAGGESDLLSA